MRRVRHILFCDQAREEVSHKMMFLGSYGSSMIVDGSFPMVMGTFVIAICVEPGTKSIERLKISIEVPGVGEGGSSDHKMETKNRYDSTTIFLNFVPFVVPEPGILRVTVSFEDGSKETGELQILDRKTYKKGAE